MLKLPSQVRSPVSRILNVYNVLGSSASILVPLFNHQEMCWFNAHWGKIYLENSVNLILFFTYWFSIMMASLNSIKQTGWFMVSFSSYCILPWMTLFIYKWHVSTSVEVWIMTYCELLASSPGYSSLNPCPLCHSVCEEHWADGTCCYSNLLKQP